MQQPGWAAEQLHPPLLPGLMRLFGVAAAAGCAEQTPSTMYRRAIHSSTMQRVKHVPCPFLLLTKRAALTRALCVVLSELTSTQHRAWHPAATEFFFFLIPGCQVLSPARVHKPCHWERSNSCPSLASQRWKRHHNYLIPSQRAELLLPHS